MKIKKLTIRGIRGIKDEISFDLNGNSLLLFGKNGTGKSSVTDAIEWFYYDKVENLSNEEIGRGGLPAIRNTFLQDNVESKVSIEFISDEKKYSFTKLLNSHLRSSNLNNEYIEKSKKENLILRYSDLMSFIIASKSDKLSYLSSIIGFDDITKHKKILKSGLNHIKAKFKTRNFELEINRRNANILKILEENITSDERFIEKINEIIKDLGERIESLEDIEILMQKFKKREDSKIIAEIEYIKRLIQKIYDVNQNLKNIKEQYYSFYQIFQEIKSNINDLKSIVLIRLWEEGIKILNVWKEEKCPLCSNQINLEEVLNNLKNQLESVKAIKEKSERLKELKQEIKKEIERQLVILKTASNDTEFYKDELKENVEKFMADLENYGAKINTELEKDILNENLIKDIVISEELSNTLTNFLENKLSSLKDKIKGNRVLEAQEKIIQVKRDYEEIKSLKKEKEVLEEIYKLLENLYDSLTQKQKVELENFIKNFSQEINYYYTKLHPDEPITDFRINTIDDEDELKGITIEYKFYEKDTSSPQRYLSESHLNSLGIAFFLASVKVFNKANKFFILDDVLSSFDFEHKSRFLDMLLELSKEYQIILSTHEEEIYKLIDSKDKSWVLYKLSEIQ